jgi:hypothetical protein
MAKASPDFGGTTFKTLEGELAKFSTKLTCLATLSTNLDVVVLKPTDSSAF